MTLPEASLFERKTGFAPLRPLLQQSCTTIPGREAVDEMAFDTDFNRVSERLRAVAEMLSFIEAGGALPVGTLPDVATVLKGVRIPGAGMTPDDLAAICQLLVTLRDTSVCFRADNPDERPSRPLLNGVASCLPQFPQLLKSIDNTIDPYGNVRDTASPELAALRREQRAMAGRVNSIMRRVMAAAAASGLIETDAAPAIRDGRLVIPVAPANKRRVNGIVHDESASGKTVFIEPAEIVEHNNRLRELEMEERREIARIMAAMAADIRPEADVMLAGYDDLGRLDFIRAKALVAREEGACMPSLHDGPELEWYHACHPTLRRSLKRHGKEIVPLDITLTPKARLLVISGPNAGGKSVTLKTVGTLQYMLQCGMLPPVHDNSHFGIFDDIFLDIGDDQSIEDDLSTYAAHLRSMKMFLQQGGARSLILIDEFGGGTEPQIGGAIAQAILARFNDMKMWGVITTHYQNLKHFADDAEGLINGSMLYDRHLMQPMFKLSIGSPGSSFALEIARKTGLPADVIDRAKEIVGSDYVNLDNYLLDITRDRRYWEQKRQQIKKKERDLEDQIAKYKERDEGIKARRQILLDEARTEASKILAGANAAIERAISDIRKADAERNATLEARRRVDAEKQALIKDMNKGREKKKHSTPHTPPSTLQKGDTVLLDGTGTPGTVLAVKGKQAEVAFGLLRTTVDISRLKVTKPAKAATAPKVTVGQSDDARRRQLRFTQELDVRGMRVDEALQAVTYYLDDAIQFRAERVRILHGTGTGALRQAIRDLLSTTPGVAKYHDEDVRLGGAGITVVNLE